MRIVKIKANEQPPEFLPRHLARLLLGLRPAEFVLLQSFIPQAEPVSVPVQNLQPALCPVAEHEIIPAERIEPHPLLHNRRKPVDRFAEIRLPGPEIYPDIFTQMQHCLYPAKPR